jgi:hypothetical protein
MPFEDVTFVTANEGWAVVLSQADHAIEVTHSFDGGTTWSSPVKVAPLDVAPGDAPPHYGVRFVNGMMGWVHGEHIYATVDGGTTWSDTGATAHAFDVAAIGDSVWAITGCDIRISTCAPALLVWNSTTRAWRAAPNQPPVTSGPLHLIRISAQQAFIAQESEMFTRLVTTNDGGATWRQLPLPCTGFAGLPVATLDGVHVWVVCPSQPGAGQQLKDVWTSADGGVAWTLRARAGLNGNVGTISSSGYAGLLALASSQTGFLTMERGDLYRSTDGGVTWVSCSISGGEGFFPALWILDPMHGWVAAQVPATSMEGRVGLYRSTDGGAHWNLVSAEPGTV